jgi:hypothetical protein
MYFRTCHLLLQATDYRGGEYDVTDGAETDNEELRQVVAFVNTNLAKFAACSSSIRIFTSTPKNLMPTVKH